MKTKKSTANYLKAIYILGKSGDVRGSNIAGYMGYARPTVSVALRSLQDEGYLMIDRDHVVTLTALGEKVACQVQDRHRTFENLLIYLGVDMHTAHQDACDMEHTVSEKSFEALKKLVKDLERRKNSAYPTKESVSYDR